MVLSKPEGGVPVDVAIPSLKKQGRAYYRYRRPGNRPISRKGLKLWAPGAPVLYDVVVASPADTVTERIGFRTLGVDGTKILVNGRPEFMRSISFHEEIPQRRGRACTMQDAVQLVGEAEALGVNMIRTAHYPPERAYRAPCRRARYPALGGDSGMARHQFYRQCDIGQSTAYDDRDDYPR